LSLEKWWIVCVPMGIGLIALIGGFVSAVGVKHNFEGKCELCHAEIPREDRDFDRIVLTRAPDQLCARCHKINERTSHPVNVVPKAPIPLARYLDMKGEMTCLTCHEVHKERGHSSNRAESKGLLRGHSQGRSFCILCHGNDMLGANWRHTLSVTYAHAPDRLIQSDAGHPLDRYSIECLSCHDGTISKTTPVAVKSGDFQHGIGLSHPVGVEYPAGARSSVDFVPAALLPDNIKLFNRKIGCLSCHNPYAGSKYLMVKDNSYSALCLTCHRK